MGIKWPAIPSIAEPPDVETDAPEGRGGISPVAIPVLGFLSLIYLAGLLAGVW
jgi:hypothetical protein